MELLAKVDNENAKLLTLIGIMNTDKLFFEFVYEVYCGRIILGEKTIEDREVNGFFDDKQSVSAKEPASRINEALGRNSRRFIWNGIYHKRQLGI